MFSRPKPKRRVLACDFCRRKKSRCNGHEMPGNSCTNCMVYAVECTYTTKNPPKGYVEELEQRLALMERLLKSVAPDVDVESVLSQMDNLEEDHVIEPSTQQDGLSATFSPVSLPGPSFERDQDHSGSDSDSEVDFVTIGQVGQRLPENGVQSPIFYGKSSGVFFFRNAVHIREELAGHQDDIKSPDVCVHKFRRQEYWVIPQWMLPTLRPPEAQFRFPETELMFTLIDLYFTYMNTFFPLLHRPSFEASIVDGLHQKDSGFGATVLLVCAIGCRFSEDPRVTHDITSSSASTAWDLFHQVGRLLQPRYFAQSIYDLQVYPLAALFLESVVTPQAPWRIIGNGIRYIQEVGAHRRRLYSAEPSAEGEMWKRAFWVLLVLDRMSCAALGRPCALQDADFDIDLPIECDDEYWTHPDPTKAFKQPPGKPSKISFFVSLIKLNQILAFALRTVYCIKKSRVVMGYQGDQWEPKVVAELDSALNKWEASIPQFLHWDPKCEEPWMFRQASILRCHYYEVQIIIHRPFVQSRKSTPLSSPSLAICTQAAHGYSNIVNGSRDRLKYCFHHCIFATFTCAVMLLIKAWSRTKTDRDGLVKDMAEVDRLLDLMQSIRKRWVMAGRFRDILITIIHAADVPTRRTKNSHLFASQTVSVGPWSSPTTNSRNWGSARVFGWADSAPSPGSDDTTSSSEDSSNLPSELASLFFAGAAPTFHTTAKPDPLDIPTVSYPTTINVATHSPWTTLPGIPQASMFPAEMMMYNNLMSEISGNGRNHNGPQYQNQSKEELPAAFQHMLSQHDVSPGPATHNNGHPVEVPNYASSTVPCGLDGWEDWATYATYLNQMQRASFPTQ